MVAKPHRLLVEQCCYRSIARICTLSPHHPLAPLALRAATRFVKRHRSVFHSLLYLLHLDPRHTETIPAVRYSPLWKPGWRVRILENKAAAVADDAEWISQRGTRIYTDGSDVDGGVGAAAVLYRGNRRIVLRHYLGPSTSHTVYEAELVGIILGLELARTENTHIGGISVALDNQAAVSACRSRSPGPGSYLVEHIHSLKREVRRRHIDLRITIRWVPGHVDVEGNEDADDEAKAAAHGDGSRRALLPACLRKSLPHSVSRLKQDRKTSIVERAKAQWLASPRFARMQRIDPSLPSKTWLATIASIPRRHASILFQLRTGHVALNKHLHRIKCADSPLCPACEEAPESVDHFLLFCPAYDRARMRLLFEGGPQTRGLHALLSERKLLRPLLQYIHETGRFKRTLGDLRLPQEAARDAPKARPAPRT